MTRCIALTLTLGTAALMMVGSKNANGLNADRHVTQVTSSAVDSDSTAHSGYIIASS